MTGIVVSLQAWWIFICANFLISAMPGPNMLHVMNQGMRQGIGRATFTMAGCMLGLFLLFGLSAMGMSALLSALPQLLTAIKIAGALYLVWVGIKMVVGHAWFDIPTLVSLGVVVLLLALSVVASLVATRERK